MLPTGKDDTQEKIIWENTTFIKRLGQINVPGFFFCFAVGVGLAHLDKDTATFWADQRRSAQNVANIK